MLLFRYKSTCFELLPDGGVAGTPSLEQVAGEHPFGGVFCYEKFHSSSICCLNIERY